MINIQKVRNNIRAPIQKQCFLCVYVVNKSNYALHVILRVLCGKKNVSVLQMIIHLFTHAFSGIYPTSPEIEEQTNQ